jgi:hypothetical protein
MQGTYKESPEGQQARGTPETLFFPITFPIRARDLPMRLIFIASVA